MKKVKLACAVALASALVFTGCQKITGNNEVSNGTGPTPVPAPIPGNDDDGNGDPIEEYVYELGDEVASRENPGVVYIWNDQWWCNSNVILNSVTGTEDSLTINYSGEGSNWFGLQIFKHENIVAGHSYLSSMTVSTSIDETIVINGEKINFTAGEEKTISVLVTGDGSIRTIGVQIDIDGSENNAEVSFTNIMFKDITEMETSITGIKAVPAKSIIYEKESTEVRVDCTEVVTLDGNTYSFERMANPALVVLTSESDAVSFEGNKVTGVKAEEDVLVTASYEGQETTFTVTVEELAAMVEDYVLFSCNEDSNVTIGDWNQFWYSGFSTADETFDEKNVKKISFGPDVNACGAWTCDLSFAPSSESKKIVLEVTLYNENNGKIKPVRPDVEFAYEGKAEWQTLTVDYTEAATLTQLGFISDVPNGVMYVSDVRLVEVDR